MIRNFDRLLPAAIALLAAGSALSQTKVDLRSQSAGVDFSAAQSTKPFKAGSVLPGACQANEAFLKTDGNTETLFLCSAAGAWTAVSGLRGTAAQLVTTDGGAPTISIANPFAFPGAAAFAASRIDAPAFTVPAGRAPAVPLSGDFWVADGRLWWHNGVKPVAFWNDDGAGGGLSGYLTVPYSAAPVFPVGGGVSQGFTMTLAGDVTSSSLSGTPAAGQEVWFRVCQDGAGGHAFAYGANVLGSGTIDPTPNACTTQAFRYDGANFVPLTGAASDALSPGLVTSQGVLDLPAAPDRLAGLASDNRFSGANDFTAAASTAPVKAGALASRPASCAAGQMYFALDAVPGQNLFLCTGVNAWSQQSAGLSSGSVFAMPAWVDYLAAVCQQSTASLGLSSPPSNAPLAACKTGANTQFGVAQFTAPGQNLQGSFVLPDDWASLMEVRFDFLSETASGAGNVAWSFEAACVHAGGDSADPVFGAPQVASIAAAGSELTNTAALSNPSVGGCSAGSRMFFRVSLAGATTAAGNEDLLGLRFKLRRNVSAL